MPQTLSAEQVRFYRENGYVVLPGALPAETLRAMRAETDRIVAEAASLIESDSRYDLEDSHTPETPRVRRIKDPVNASPVFKDLMGSETICAILRPLLGDDIRFHHGKMNMKHAEYGAPVEWHTDWAFYPHTNDDVLEVGMLLDDCDEANGPLLVIPGSHTGPAYNHHADGYFCGAMDPRAQEVDFEKAVALTGPAGTITLHHVRTVHGSSLNRSDHPRRLLLYGYTAADAWPLSAGVGPGFDLAAFNAQMVTGEPTLRPRLAAVPVQLPLPPAPKGGSIYENQKGTAARYFDTFEAVTAAAGDGASVEAAARR